MSGLPPRELDKKIVIDDFISALNFSDGTEEEEEVDSSVSLTFAFAASLSALAMLF